MSYLESHARTEEKPINIDRAGYLERRVDGTEWYTHWVHLKGRTLFITRDGKVVDVIELDSECFIEKAEQEGERPYAFYLFTYRMNTFASSSHLDMMNWILSIKKIIAKSIWENQPVYPSASFIGGELPERVPSTVHPSPYGVFKSLPLPSKEPVVEISANRSGTWTPHSPQFRRTQRSPSDMRERRETPNSPPLPHHYKSLVMGSSMQTEEKRSWSVSEVSKPDYASFDQSQYAEFDQKSSFLSHSCDLPTTTQNDRGSNWRRSVVGSADSSPISSPSPEPQSPETLVLGRQRNSIAMISSLSRSRRSNQVSPIQLGMIREYENSQFSRSLDSIPPNPSERTE